MRTMYGSLYGVAFIVMGFTPDGPIWQEFSVAKIGQEEATRLDAEALARAYEESFGLTRSQHDRFHVVVKRKVERDGVLVEYGEESCSI